MGRRLMRHARGHRQPLTLQEIGRSRFWVGLAAGFGSTVAFYLFFGGLRDAATGVVLAHSFTLYGDPNFVSAWFDGSNPLQFSPWFRYVQNLFLAGVAVTVAQGITFSVWLTHRGWHEAPRTRRHRTWSLTWAVMWSWLMAWIVLKAGETYMLYIYMTAMIARGSGPPLPLLHDYGWLFALLVVVLFLEQWKGLRLTYRCGRWLLAAAGISATIALLLALIQPLWFL